MALVTGASSFLGRAITLKLAERGFDLALLFQNSREKTKRLSVELERHGAKTLLVKADLRESKNAAAVIQEVVKSFKRLDVLINNASLFYPTPLAKGKASQWREIFEVNLISPYFLARAAAPWLKKNTGCVINLSDIYGENPRLKNHSAYCVSKAGLNAMTRVLAGELGPEIRVNSVSPGAIFIPNKFSQKRRRELIDRSVLKRQGKPGDISEAVFFLASNNFITGQNLNVDGGRFF